jgi:amidohydrolase
MFNQPRLSIKSLGNAAASAVIGLTCSVTAQGGVLDEAINAVEPQVIAWRRDIHEHPELSNREFRTAALVAAHLRALDIDVRTDVAHTGVVGTLVGGQPGPVIALRADMDALPVTEQVDLPFASKVRAEYNGAKVGVMHACGHDAHVAILMGAAEVLAARRESIKGTIQFFFQPAEEGAPAGEQGGAKLMIEEGVLDGDNAPEAIFGLHVFPFPAGMILYRPEGAMAAADWLTIKVTGRQTHGSSPWLGVDPITVTAQIINAIQAISSRQLDVTKAPAVVTIGAIHGGVRGNIIPDSVELTGTIRTFDREMQADLHDRIRRTAEHVAKASGAEAEVIIDAYSPVTYNDPDLVTRMLPALRWAAGDTRVMQARPITASEDFSYFQERIPGLYIGLGVNAPGVGPLQAAANHSPLFFVNEDTLVVGVRAMVGMALQYTDSEL